MERWPNGAEKVVEIRSKSGELLQRQERHFNYLRRSQVNYKNGLPHGEYNSWRSDGTPEWSGRMVEGMREGEWTLWLNTLGDKLQQGSYRHGLQDGEWRAWHPGGGMREISHWCEGVLCGAVESWDRDGNLLTRSNCWSSDSIRFFQRFHREGKMILEYECRGSTKTGRWSRWDYTGNLVEERLYRNDSLNGATRTWYTSGNLRSLFSFENNRRAGLQLLLTPQGDTLMNCLLEQGTGRCRRLCSPKRNWICADSSWKEGKLHGEVISWNLSHRRTHELWRQGNLEYQKEYLVQPRIVGEDTVGWNSTLLQEGGFKEGLMDGLWKRWNKKGVLIEKKNFLAGKLHGEQLLYDSLGRAVQRRIHHGEHRGITLETLQPDKNAVSAQAVQR